MADLPIAAIVCIAVGCYVVVLVGIILLCYFLKGRGSCGQGSHCCAKEEGAQSCECCLALAEACNCCKSPSLASCLNSCCPKGKRITCVDIIMCQCCSSEGMTLCDCCNREEKETCNCLCLEIRMRSPRDKHELGGGGRGGGLKRPPHLSSTASTYALNAKHAWMPDFTDADGRQFGWVGGRDLQLDLGYFRSAAFPISTHPITSNRSENSGDFIPTSTPRFHQGQSQLFIRPGVHSAGRVIAKRQSPGGGGGGAWHGQPSRRSLSRRRSASTRRRSSVRRSSVRQQRSPAGTLVRSVARSQSVRQVPSQPWLEDDLL